MQTTRQTDIVQGFIYQMKVQELTESWGRYGSKPGKPSPSRKTNPKIRQASFKFQVSDNRVQRLERKGKKSEREKSLLNTAGLMRESGNR